MFDRNILDGAIIDALTDDSCSCNEVTLTKNPFGGLYDDIYECASDTTLAAPLGCIIAANGFCNAGEESVGDYLVIVKHVDTVTSKRLHRQSPSRPSRKE